MALQPYLFFTNTAREAMTRYQAVLGGELEIMSAADMPEGEPPPGATADSVMHAALTLPGGGVLYASDDPSGDGAGVKGAGLSLDLADEAAVREAFDALADGGSVTMPPERTFWSPLFGVCVDRFGVTWMLGVAPADPS